jgi:hypothetical protein
LHQFKLKTGIAPDYPIDKTTFEEQSRMQEPYYIDEDTQYAVCPRCDNPIQIIGLYKRLENTPRPFGRHLRRSIEGLAEYAQERYDYCPLANPQKPNPNKKRSGQDGIPNALLALLREQFDRVVYLLSRDTGIVFSEGLLRKMLKTFLDVDGCLYPWATTVNLPWMFGYRAQLQTLYGQKIREDSNLRKALEKVPNAAFDENGCLVKGSGFLRPIMFCFIDHAFKNSNGDQEESLRFSVWQENPAKPRPHGYDIVFEEKIIVDQKSFMYLVNLPPERARRNERFPRIAQSVLGREA